MRSGPVFLCFGLLVLSACGDGAHYPISGEPCSPDDPVHTLDACDMNVMGFLAGPAKGPVPDVRFADGPSRQGIGV